LDVSPRETSKASDVFATQSGFRNTLTGVYLMLADGNLYGKNTSYYLPELLVRHWILPSDNFSSDTYTIPNYDFANYKGDGLFTTVWLNYYKAVAQLNNLLAELDKTDTKFSNDTEQFLKAEALGLRAFIHLEILRYWGPVPALATDETPAVPYVTEMTFDAEKLKTLTWSEVTGKIEADLNIAQAILKEYDLIQNTAATKLNSTSTSDEGKLSDLWFHYRQNRMNYYAVLATKARFYNWMESTPSYPAAKDSALYYALEVINAVNSANGQKQFTLVNRQTLTSNGLTLFGECIFALHNPKLQEVIQASFKNNPPQLTQSSDNLNVAYESSLNTQDMRYGSISDGRYWQNVYDPSNGTFNRFLKYNDEAGTQYGTTTTRNQIPLLRLSEMYLIAIERQPDLAKVKTYFQTFRIARSMNSSLDNTLTGSAEIQSRLEKEYRKEFYGEGQMFFFYKKQQYLSFSYPDAFSLPKGLDSYRLPLPKNQQQFEQ
jgi:hypothetical protein